MYYQTRVHRKKEVNGAMEAATLIKNQEAAGFDALTWKTQNGVFYAVSDSHIDDSNFAETALLVEEGEKFYQIESITSGLIKTTEELAECFIESEVDFPIKREVNLIINSLTGDEKAYFTCGCCGNRFFDNVSYQLKFDQDTGYGICKKCDRYYK
ncbi:MAG: hypothetical protein EOM23_09860 [Candidatus Moranbacteria bacterium]|nr:hypothetical protein [Candidatus Moranbacteria bacterium]